MSPTGEKPVSSVCDTTQKESLIKQQRNAYVTQHTTMMTLKPAKFFFTAWVYTHNLTVPSLEADRHKRKKKGGANIVVEPAHTKIAKLLTKDDLHEKKKKVAPNFR